MIVIVLAGGVVVDLNTKTLLGEKRGVLLTKPLWERRC